MWPPASSAGRPWNGAGRQGTSYPRVNQLHTKLDCYSCLVRQALSASRFAGMDDEAQRAVMNRALFELQNLNGSSTPPETVNKVYSAIAEVTGGLDLFREVKARSTREALQLYPELKKVINKAENRFETAVRLAIAGNIIDFAASETYDLKDSVRGVSRAAAHRKRSPRP